MAHVPTTPAFEGIDLTESFVLGWQRGNDLVISMEFCLCEDHPQYRTPPPGEWACFVRGFIQFLHLKALDGLPEMDAVKGAVDATGERDFGHIEGIGFANGDFWLECEFGTISGTSDHPTVSLDP